MKRCSLLVTNMETNGSSMAKKSAISRMIDLMKKRGFYAEMDVELIFGDSYFLILPILPDGVIE